MNSQGAAAVEGSNSGPRATGFGRRSSPCCVSKQGGMVYWHRTALACHAGISRDGRSLSQPPSQFQRCYRDDWRAQVSPTFTRLVACYAEGARYAKHCDNVCHAGEGSACNGRRLTAILYLNKCWRPKHGGQLLLYPPLATDLATHGDSDDAPPIGSIAPIANRLLLFFADARVPHEVQTSHADRLAITLWFYDIEEVQRAAGGMVSSTI